LRFSDFWVCRLALGQGYTPPRFTRLASPTRTRGPKTTEPWPASRGNQQALSAERSSVESLQDFDDHLHEMAWERPVDEMAHWRSQASKRCSHVRASV
jgi:hypothetical protein